MRVLYSRRVRGAPAGRDARPTPTPQPDSRYPYPHLSRLQESYINVNATMPDGMAPVQREARRMSRIADAAQSIVEARPAARAPARAAPDT